MLRKILEKQIQLKNPQDSPINQLFTIHPTNFHLDACNNYTYFKRRQILFSSAIHFYAVPICYPNPTIPVDNTLQWEIIYQNYKKHSLPVDNPH